MTDRPRSQTKDRCNHAHAAIIAPNERYLPEVRTGRHQSPLIQLWHCAQCPAPTLNSNSGPERELKLSQQRIKRWRTLPQVAQTPFCRPTEAFQLEDGCLKGRPDGAEAYVGLT